MLKIELYKLLHRRVNKLNGDLYNVFMEDNDGIPTLWPTSDPDGWDKLIKPIFIHDLVEFALIYYPTWNLETVKKNVADAVQGGRVYRFLREDMKLETVSSAKRAWNVFINHNNVTIF